MAAFHINRQQAHKKRFSFIKLLFIVVFLLAALIAGTLIWYQNSLEPVSDSTEEVVVTIEVGATTSDIAMLLENKGLIRSETSFSIYTRFNDFRGKMQAGGYKISPSLSTQEIVNKLVSGDVATDLFTILPAQRIDQVRAAFVSDGYTVDEINTALDAENYEGHPALEGKPAESNLEGYLYPNSYQKTETTAAEEIVRSALDEMAEALSPEIKAEFEKKNLSTFEAITLASIVEREVNNSADRAIVAQVFLKRYQEGISLGSDPTALYGALLFGLEPTVFTDTPYNTRIYTGLPPGPINNVSTASLMALAYPADTDYLFFVSGDDGKTYFSNTLSEHEALTAEHCIELCNSY
jgi:UPF0755 protein